MGDEEPREESTPKTSRHNISRRSQRFHYREATVNGAFGGDGYGFCPISILLQSFLNYTSSLIRSRY